MDCLLKESLCYVTTGAAEALLPATVFLCGHGPNAHAIYKSTQWIVVLNISFWAVDGSLAQYFPPLLFKRTNESSCPPHYLYWSHR